MWNSEPKKEFYFGQLAEERTVYLPEKSSGDYCKVSSIKPENEESKARMWSRSQESFETWEIDIIKWLYAIWLRHPLECLIINIHDTQK